MKSITIESVFEQYDVKDSGLSYEDVINNLDEHVYDFNETVNAYLLLESLLTDDIATEATFINVKMGLTVAIDRFKLAMRKILEVISDFLNTMVVHMQSTIFKQDVRLLKDNIQVIKAFFTKSISEQKDTKALYTVYSVSNPIEEYLKDKQTIDHWFDKRILKHMNSKVEEFKKLIYNMPALEYVKQLFGMDALNKDVHGDLPKFWSELLGEQYTIIDVKQPDMLGKIRKKYYGDNKQTEVQDVLSMVSSETSLSGFISEEAFNSEKLFKDKLNKAISSTRKAMNELDTISNDLYTQTLVAMYIYYNSLLNTLVKIPMIYWGIYNDLRNSTIKCVKSIIRNDEDSKIQ